MLKNYMEELVDYYVKQVIEDNHELYPSLCKCAACVAEIKAETLNHLKPFYITCKTGEVYGEYNIKEQQETADLIKEIAKAIETVHARAHREPEDALARLLMSKVKKKE